MTGMLQNMNKPLDLRHLLDEADMTITQDAGIRAFTMWDQPESAEDRWGMENFENLPWVKDVHNSHVGERCFLIGSGPSIIDQLPLLHKLSDEYTFTCNRLRKWDAVPFRPFIHCVTEPGPVFNFGSAIHPFYDFPGAQNKVVAMWWKIEAPGWLWLPKASDDIQIRWQGFFGCGDDLPPIPSGWASPLTISQLAAWMGFSEMYVLGCDLTDMGQAWDRENGTTKNKRSVRSTLECFDRARMTLESHGRKMVDCTPGGQANVQGVLEYVPLEEVLGG